MPKNGDRKVKITSSSDKSNSFDVPDFDDIDDEIEEDGPMDLNSNIELPEKDTSLLVQELSTDHIDQDAMDEEQKFLASLTVSEARYISTKLSYPSLSGRELAEHLSLKPKEIRILEGSERLNAFLNKKFQNQVKNQINAGLSSFSRISSVLASEFEKRVSDYENNRLDAKKLIDGGYRGKDVAEIMKSRIEGMPLKDLINSQIQLTKANVDISKNAESITREEEVEVIEDMSKRFLRYRKKVTTISADKFDPKRYQGEDMGIVEVQSKRVNRPVNQGKENEPAE